MTHRGAPEILEAKSCQTWCWAEVCCWYLCHILWEENYWTSASCMVHVIWSCHLMSPCGADRQGDTRKLLRITSSSIPNRLPAWWPRGCRKLFLLGPSMSKQTLIFKCLQSVIGHEQAWHGTPTRISTGGISWPCDSAGRCSGRGQLCWVWHVLILSLEMWLIRGRSLRYSSKYSAREDLKHLKFCLDSDGLQVCAFGVF